jgi:leader peptidase (prepilin peptidase) / N-methyltransferase
LRVLFYAVRLYNRCMVLLPLFIFILGLLIGSFLNVVILRMNTGRSVVTGRSKCARCGRVLSWYELIPVFSFLKLRGKCRTCHTPISFQYPLVELITGIVFIMLYTKIVLVQGLAVVPFIIFAFLCVVASLMIVILVYDVKHKIIPDAAVYPFILLSIVSIVWRTFMHPGFAPGAAVVNGVFVALPFFLLWFLSKGRLMGFGDVKLTLGIGWFLGLSMGFMAVIFAFWFGGVVGLFILATSRKHTMKSEVPFAPFLILGFAVAGLWSITIQTLFPLWQ